jgi:hypothetical protein
MNAFVNCIPSATKLSVHRILEDGCSVPGLEHHSVVQAASVMGIKANLLDWSVWESQRSS